MNIGIVCYASVGGSGIVATELAKSLAGRGHDVHVMSTDTPFRFGDYQPGLTFHRVHTPAYPLFREPQYVLSLANRIVQVSREFDLDVVHAHYAVPHATAAYLAKQILLASAPGRVPQVITTLHGTDITLVGSDRSYSETVAFSIDRSDGVTAVSESLRADTYRALPVRKPIAVIPNFLDCNVHRRIPSPDLRARYAPGDYQKLVIHVSNFRPVKRVDAVVDVFARIAEKVPARLLLVGDGPDLGKALDRARALGVARHVEALGEQDQILRLLSISDLFLLPSEQESFGLAALEAMACEVPVVASRVGGLHEVIDHGASGFLHDPSDLDGMAASGVAVLTDPALHERIAAEGRRIVEERFCCDLVVPRYEAFYESLLTHEPLGVKDLTPDDMTDDRSPRFAPEYVECVLSEVFEDAVAQFLGPLVAIHYAHLVMLADQGIVAACDARAIRDALDRLPVGELPAARFDGVCEDLFYFVERLIEAGCGAERAGRLHTARSRNDIDMTMYRMHQRAMILDLARDVETLRACLLDLADRHRDTVFAAHTHTQPAQPTTIAHYLLAVVEMLERDHVRLRAAYASTNHNPLGACAITGTGFPIDRRRTTELLGFDAPTGNTYGSIATVDYLLESVTAAAVLVTGLGRVLQDLLLWCMPEFGYLRLGEGFAQGSSIMPQKRNPVALEHARAIASKALGQAGAVLVSVHNTPFGDIVDTEDDLQPLVTSMFKDASRAVRLVAAAMAAAEFNRERLAARAAQGWITVTELADTLVRDHDVPFKTSHAIAARFVAASADEPGAAPAKILRDASTAVLGRAIDYDDESLARLLSPEHFVAVRRTPGGPAPEETARAIALSLQLLARDRTWQEETGQRLTSAEARLREAVRGL